MTTHELRIECVVAGRTIASEQKVGFLGLPQPAPPIRILLPELRSRRGQWALTLNALGLPSAQAAQAIAEPLKTALLLAGPLLGMWIDVSTRRAAGSPASSRADPEEPISLRDFEKAVIRSYAAGKTLTRNQVLPAALYNESYFHSSSAGRFLSLMNALEVMAVPADKLPTAEALVEQMIRSVSQPDTLPASRALVRTHCGESAVDMHDRAYQIRNAMVLEGRPRTEIDLAKECSQLDELVKQLVVKRVIGE